MSYGMSALNRKLFSVLSHHDGKGNLAWQASELQCDNIFDLVEKYRQAGQKGFIVRDAQTPEQAIERVKNLNQTPATIETAYVL